VSYAAEVAKTKADEAGVSEGVSTNAKYFGDTLKSYGSYYKEQAGLLTQQAYEGQISQQASEKASKAYSMLGGIGSSLLGRVNAQLKV